jgi:hypothetical protein
MVDKDGCLAHFNEKRGQFHGIIGASAPMQRVCSLIEALAYVTCASWSMPSSMPPFSVKLTSLLCKTCRRS